MRRYIFPVPVVLLALLVLLSGCDTKSPIQTDKQQQAAETAPAPAPAVETASSAEAR